MENFRKEIEEVIARHPEIGDVTITIKRSVTIDIPSTPSIYIPIMSPNISPIPITTSSDPVNILEASVNAAKIAELKRASQTQ